MAKKHIITIIGIILIIGGASVSTYTMLKNKPEPKKGVKKEKIVSIKAEAVKYIDVDNIQEYSGRVNAAQTYILSSEVAGRIMRTNVALKEGNTFRKGQKLVHIFDDDIEASLKSQKSSFMNTIASVLPDIKIDYKSEYDKWYGFFKQIKIAEPLPSLPPINSDQERFFLASRNLITEYFSIKQSEILLAKYNVYAPFNGTFKSVRLEAGSIASPGSEIGVISRTDALEVIIEVEPWNAKWIKAGDKVEVEVDGIETKSIKGFVSRKAHIVDPTSQTIKVYVKINPKKGDEIYEGQFVSVEFKGDKIHNVVEIPREAVSDSKYIFTVIDNKLHQEEIDVVKINGDSYFIQGLTKDEIIVTESVFNGKEGMPVQVRN
ncbi:efflux RND transporter periplasmic adaptor subunit [Flammeovirga kamogawensis]|uniref:HlyD family efflux transporter periplasmic adaptor subunit n=1 Tax=Flammeovirga kamogawensis TaxID=373891 RepID=A0ABX8GY77_9BACT|nr:HlyD family efflux transporter periplasmic adaptor subunit [Flammeovirga kamogawensis]MBB6462879.1 multidrug efflux pump subunit AcrA (membrane-fusion protein) [Flammeovirga kamogawensis]QWG08339.1 HlyD family efflux transporter periplasmic adaptor subunit [Flammeovirga kamogawensis]TRX66636.1 HlyD family efflux transporter periplasmic adaptor subunit [Flammeovirga kamogawensis]